MNYGHKKLQEMSSEAGQYRLRELESLFDAVQELKEHDRFVVIDTVEEYLEKTIILMEISEMN